MIKRDDITGKFNEKKKRIDIDDWSKLEVSSLVSGGQFSALTHDQKTLFRVSVELYAEAYISENDSSGIVRVESKLRNRLMHCLYRDIFHEVHNIKMSIELEGREAALGVTDRLLDKLSKEMHGDA